LFNNFPLHKQIAKALTKQGFHEATPVQDAAIPAALAGDDLIVSAQTGSGKSAAFIVPILQRLLSKKAPNSGTRALILVPTRELARQLGKHVSKMAEFCGIDHGVITGGQEYKYQTAIFRKNPEIIIATPGRLNEHVEKSKDLLDDVELLVLDEADRMLDMGFAEEVAGLASLCRLDRQTMLFSATLQQRGLTEIIDQVLDKPQRIIIDDMRGGHDNISQQMCLADDDAHKERITTYLLANEEYRQAIIFTNTKIKTQELGESIARHQEKVGILHGDMTQDERNYVMQQMRNGSIRILVATDVAARGLDVKGIDLVINFNMARSGDDYVHRIGRTGRAGESGTAISLIDHTEWNLKNAIERYLRVTLQSKKIKSLEGKYRGPKKVKGSGKASTPKHKKKEAKKAGKKPAVKKPSGKKSGGKRANAGTGEVKRKPKLRFGGDGNAPFKPKKKDND
jgi:superfamily II DNA/RNA helicase